jgi:hypothetical protein
MTEWLNSLAIQTELPVAAGAAAKGSPGVANTATFGKSDRYVFSTHFVGDAGTVSTARSMRPEHALESQVARVTVYCVPAAECAGIATVMAAAVVFQLVPSHRGLGDVCAGHPTTPGDEKSGSEELTRKCRPFAGAQ